MSAATAGVRFNDLLEELFGKRHSVRFTASGSSMHPTIRDGESITVTPLGDAPIRTGDVVLYRRGRAAIAHRVVRIQPSTGPVAAYLLRGDATWACDPPVTRGQLLGRVIAAERFGHPIRIDAMNPRLCRVIAHISSVMRHCRTLRFNIVNACHVKLHEVI